VRAPTHAVRRLAALALMAAALSLAGCATQDIGRVNILDARIDKSNRPTYMGMPIRTGQLILSEAPGPYSFFFALVPQDFYRFTHAAVIVVEDGEPWVYDVSGRYKPGIDDRPTDGIVGGLRKQKLMDYCRPNLYAEVYDPPAGVDGEKVAAWLRAKAETGVEFDAYFRHDEKERLYCTEFVDEALKAGGAKPVSLVPTTSNPSMRLTMDYLAVPPSTCLPAAAFSAPERYRAAIGIFGSRTAAQGYFEAKREVHRRFTRDQKLGNLFINASGDILLREPIIDFARKAVHLFDGARRAPSDAAVALAVRELADATFGPCPPLPAEKR